MIRQVPAPPLLSPVHRRLARLPLGGPTGLACAVAGVACVVGFLLIGPSVGLSLPFRDEPVIANQAPHSQLEARSAASKPTTKAAAGAPGGDASSGGHAPGAGADQDAKPAATAEATDPPDASEPDKDESDADEHESTPAPTRTPTPDWTREESDRTDGEHDHEWSDAERDDEPEHDGEDPTP
jgi:hypothetical protein